MQGSYSAARQAGGRAAGQLLPHTTAVARSKAQQQRQQLQQRWQQQAQQQQQHVDRRPGTAPAANGRCGDSSVATGDAAAQEDDCCSSAVGDSKHCVQGWHDQQQQAGPNSRPSTAAGAAQSTPRNRRQQTAHAAGSSSTPQQQQLPQLQAAVTRSDACSPLLQPADVEHLTGAQSWVQNWPEAVGNTRLLTALVTAHQYTFNSSSSSSTGDCIDSYYLFSDGLADDAAACLEWVRQQEEAGQPLRPVHTVGETMLLLPVHLLDDNSEQR
jgi:hypothetical protein